MQQTITIRSQDGAEVRPDVDAAERFDGNASLIGRILVRQGRLGERDAERVLAYAARKGLRFGEAAVKMGLLSRQDLAHAVAAQFDYPYLEKGAGGYSSKLVAAFEPFSAKGDAIRVLRAQLTRHWFGAGQRALAIIGPSGREGCSYVAANLAVMFSQLGESTVLVDADISEPEQHRLFNVSREPGLSAALVGRVPIQSAVTRLPLFRNLSLLPAGITPPNLYDLFGREELGAIVASLKERYSVVLFDTRAFAANMGADMVARHCGGALMVVRRNHTRLADSQSLIEGVTGLGAKVVGSALTQF